MKPLLPFREYFIAFGLDSTVALNLLKASRIDHRVRCLEDSLLVKKLKSEKVPLTVCPLSNLELKVVDVLSDLNLPKMLDLGLVVTIHSDDPAYFRGYMNANYLAVQKAFSFNPEQIYQLAKNALQVTFLSEAAKKI